MDRRLLALLFLIVVAACGTGLILVITANDPGVTPDSVTYLQAARSLLDGQGFMVVQDGHPVPMTHFPPLFPAVLAAGSLTGSDLIDGARVLNGLLFGLTVFLVGSWIYVETSGRLWAAVLGCVLVLTSRPLLEVYSMVWSEPLFIVLALSALWLLASHLRTGRAARLVMSGAAIGLAFATRYAGVALLAVAWLCLVGFGWRTLVSRRWTLLIFGAASLGPALGWMLRNARLAGTVTNREIVFHPVTARTLLDGGKTLTQWSPVVLLAGIGVVAVAVLVAAAVAALRKPRERRVPWPDTQARFSHAQTLLISFLVGYPAFMLLSISFFDGSTPLDGRVLSPLFPVITILAVIWIDRLWQSNRASRVALIGVVGLIVFASAIQALSWGLAFHRLGSGFTSRDWRASQAAAFIRTLPADTIIYSNGPDAVHFLTARPAIMLPRTIDPITLQQNHTFRAEIARLDDDPKNDTVIVLFDRIDDRWYLPGQEELLATLSLTVLVDTDDGMIYRAGTSSDD